MTSDTLLVRETIERFHDAVNRRDAARCAELFGAQGVWEVAPPFEHRFEGRAAIEKGITGTLGATVFLVQSTGPIVVDLVSEKRAKARTSLQEFGRFVDGASMRATGTYYDELERQDDGTWRFLHRRFEVSYHEDSPLPGVVLHPAERSSR
ncbi:nuclear transport factor 2 family protein [Corallococcus sp. M34]|uniref:YybH family protein n=1 Tax=Citreicoccus inhibens TaxID=2849499 RepID=UPI001C232805|nr:nuclear transport factor 2 family protein [Citreicoccus inhibens]MBU8900687.1 nuclear transport factor 2 family protein [Citreicoccus inhibens]